MDERVMCKSVKAVGVMSLVEKVVLNRYKRVVELLASIHYHGNFEPETANEKELDTLLETLGYKFDNEDDLIAAVPPDKS